MKNFNNHSEQKNSSNQWESFSDDFQSFSLEYLNNESSVESVDTESSIEAARNEIDKIFENNERGGEFRKMSAERGRESSNFFEGAHEARSEAENWGDYSGRFVEFGVREDFVARNENRNRSVESLSNEIASVKSQVRSVDLSQRVANFGRAIIGRAA